MIKIFALIVFAVPITAFAQSGGTDYQLRIPVHMQLVRPDAKVGFGGWWVLPNVTAKNNTFRSKIVGGVLYKQPKRWIEFMGGAMVYQNGSVDPLANAVFQDRSFRGVALFSNVEYYPRTKQAYTLTSADVRLPCCKRFPLRGGAEFDSTVRFGKRDSFGIGPRLVVQLNKHISIVTTYHFRNETNVLRQYLIFNLP